jgi:hypothetical protein
MRGLAIHKWVLRKGSKGNIKTLATTMISMQRYDALHEKMDSGSRRSFCRRGFTPGVYITWLIRHQNVDEPGGRTASSPSGKCK